MKRLLISLAILLIGASCIYGLHVTAIQLQRDVARKSQALLDETQQLALAMTQLRSVTEEVRDLQEKLASVQTAPGSKPDEVATIVRSHLSPSQSERLLAELGFNWGNSGDYLIVSKDTLRAISLEGMRGTKLNNTACQVLATTPAECAAIEGTAQALMENYKTWAAAHVQRQEPSGDVVAKYALPADPDFSQSLSNNFANAVLTSLGEERGNLFLDYARSWMLDLGLEGGSGDNSLTVKRNQLGNEPHLSYELRYSGNIMNTEVSPYQEFPLAFRPLFPNGWSDLAEREGFELPKAFRKQ